MMFGDFFLVILGDVLVIFWGCSMTFLTVYEIFGDLCGCDLHLTAWILTPLPCLKHGF